MAKKLLCALMALMMSVALVACNGGGTGNSGNGGNGELSHATFSVFVANAGPTVAITDTAIGQMILDELNVTLDIEYATGDIDTKINTMLFSGDYPDLIVANTQDNQKALIEAEALVNLEEYIANDDVVADAYTTEDYDLLAMVKSSNGGDGVFYLPYSVGGAAGNELTQAFYIAVGALAENDYPEVTTIDQYFDLIRTFANDHANEDILGFIMQNGQTDAWRFDSITNPVPALNGYQNDGGWLVDKQADGTYTVRNQAGSDEEYEYMKKLNALYNDGLVDPEFITDRHDQFATKMVSGRVVGYFGWGYEVGEWNNSLAANGKADRIFVPVRLLNEGITTDKYNCPALPDISKGMGISVNCSNPERAFTMLSMMLSEDLYQLRKWGVEGEDFQVDADGKLIMDGNAYNYYSNGTKMDLRGLSGGTFLGFPERPSSFTFANGMASYPSLEPAYQNYVLTPYDKAYLAEYGLNSYTEMFDQFDMPYGLAYTISDGFSTNTAERNTLEAINDIIAVDIPNMIRASEADFDNLWNAYKNKLNNLSTGTMAALNQAMAAEINARVNEGRFA